MVETANATTSRVGVSSQDAGLGATADACTVPDADPLGAVHGRLVHGRPRDGVCFPSRDEVHALPAVRAASNDRVQAGATR